MNKINMDTGDNDDHQSAPMAQYNVRLVIKSNFKKYKTIIIPSSREWLQIIKVSENINHTDFNSSSLDNFSCKANLFSKSKLPSKIMNANSMN